MRTTIIAAAVLSACNSAAAQCTPATINPSIIQQLRPHMTLPAVTAIAGCPPDATVTPVGISAAWHTGVGPVFFAAFDAEGLLSAGYTPLLEAPVISGVGGLRVEPGPGWVVRPFRGP